MQLEYINIIDAVQYAVNKVSKQLYKEDKDTPPRFIVSQYDVMDKEGKIIDHKILLTVEHMGWKRSRVLFPRLDHEYGYTSLKDEITYLYNSTM